LRKEKRCKQKGNVIYLVKMIIESFPNLKKVCPFRYRKPLGHQTDLTIIEPLHSILSLKQQAQRAEK
jgi:hypothetical protein